MKKRILAALVLSLTAGMLFTGTTSYAKNASNEIAVGVYAGEVNLSGLTKEEAKEAVEAYFLEKAEEKINHRLIFSSVNGSQLRFPLFQKSV